MTHGKRCGAGFNQSGSVHPTLSQILNAFRIAALAKGEMLGKLHEANPVAALLGAVAVEPIFAGVDEEGGVGFLMQRQSPTNSERASAGRPLQLCCCRYCSRGMLCLSRSKSSLMVSTVLPASGYEPVALIPTQGWWVGKESRLSEAQGPRPDDS